MTITETKLFESHLHRILAILCANMTREVDRLDQYKDEPEQRKALRDFFIEKRDAARLAAQQGEESARKLADSGVV